MQNPTNKTAPLLSSARLIVADGYDLTRESIRLILEEEPYLRILDEAKDGQEAIELGRLHRPDLVLMEVCMPRVNGFEATRVIKAELFATKVLIVSAYENLVFISEARRAGADGYVLKLAPLEVLLEAVRGVLGGESRYPSKCVELG